MDLKSGYPYWAVKNGLMYAFPQLDADLSCDVAVVGAGIPYSLLGAGLLRAQIERRSHPLTGLFSFARLGCH
jgi:hypothetical protein